MSPPLRGLDKMVCADLSWVYSLSVLSLGITLIVIGVAYALGQLLSNPQFNVWAKTEIFQVFVSFFFVILVIYLNGSFCTFKYSSIASLSPHAEEYSHPQILGDDNVMDAAGKYLANVAYFIKTDMRAARAVYGVMEEASRYTRIPCMPAITFCFYGMNGYNVRPYSGFSGWIQMLGFSLYTDTASYLTVLVQMGLLAFISGGGIMAYLPFAIIFRSLPFMRQLGGGLLAICISLFLIYPGLLVVESLFWNPYSMLGDADWRSLENAAEGISGGFTHGSYEGIVGAMASAGAVAWGPVGAAIGAAVGALIVVIIEVATHYAGVWEQAGLEGAMQAILRAGPISFLSATFLFAFNMIAIGASARELGRLLGQEVDLSRLMQVV